MLMLRIFELATVLVGVYAFNYLVKKSIEKDVKENPATAVNHLYEEYEAKSKGIEEDAIR